MSEMYILIHENEAETVWACYDKGLALAEAQGHVNQKIGDFYRHALPMRASEGNFEVRLIEVGDDAMSTELTLPIQSWIDEYYVEMSARDAKRGQALADPEWAEYQRLSEKFRGA